MGRCGLRPAPGGYRDLAPQPREPGEISGAKEDYVVGKNENNVPKILSLAASLTASLLVAAPAPAQDAAYPARPVRVIVNVAAGGGVDTATRIVGQKLHARFAQPFVIENHPGAGGNIGAETVFLAEPNGYTLLSSSPSPLAINGWLYRKLNFDPAGFEP